MNCFNLQSRIHSQQEAKTPSLAIGRHTSLVWGNKKAVYVMPHRDRAGKKYYVVV